MALIQSVLASGIAALAPTDSEAVAVTGLTNAWQTYFMGASVMGIPIGPFAAATAAFRGALSGMSLPNAAAAKIAAAVTAFWTTLAPLGPTLWILAPAVITPPLTPPVGLGALAADLATAFASNSTPPGSTVPQAAARIAAAMHLANMGAIAIVQPPPPLPPVPTPIL